MNINQKKFIIQVIGLNQLISMELESKEKGEYFYLSLTTNHKTHQAHIILCQMEEYSKFILMVYV